MSIILDQRRKSSHVRKTHTLMETTYKIYAKTLSSIYGSSNVTCHSSPTRAISWIFIHHQLEVKLLHEDLSFCRVTFYPLTHPSTSSSSTARRRHLTRTTCIVILSSSLLNLLRGRPFHFRRTTHDLYLRCSQCEFCQRELFTAATPDCCGKFTTLAVFRRIGVRKREILDGHKVLRSVWVVW